MNIKVINKSKHLLPECSFTVLSGTDLKAKLKNDFILEPRKRICQMIISKHETEEWENIENHLEAYTESSGFGHIGEE